MEVEGPTDGAVGVSGGSAGMATAVGSTDTMTTNARVAEMNVAGSGLTGAAAGTGAGDRRHRAGLTGNQRRAAKRQRQRDARARDG